jgi:hypothetical protein
MKSKNVVQSTSAWGAVLLLIPIVFQLVGAPLTGEEVDQVSKAGAAIDGALLHLMTIVGTIQMIIGRFNARQPIHFLPGRQFVIEQDGTKRLIDPAKAPFRAAPVTLPDDVKRKIEGS